MLFMLRQGSEYQLIKRDINAYLSDRHIKP